MRELIVSSITSNSAAPFDRDTVEFLQNLIWEQDSLLAKALIPGYQTGIIYALDGAVVTKSGDDYDVSAGWVFYNGELYRVNATSFTASSGQVGVFSVLQIVTNKLFSNNQSKPWLNNRIMQFTSAVAGSGAGDWNQLKYKPYSDIWRPLELFNDVTPIATPQWKIGDNKLHFRGSIAGIDADLNSGPNPNVFAVTNISQDFNNILVWTPRAQRLGVTTYFESGSAEPCTIAFDQNNGFIRLTKLQNTTLTNILLDGLTMIIDQDKL